MALAKLVVARLVPRGTTATRDQVAPISETLLSSGWCGFNSRRSLARSLALNARPRAYLSLTGLWLIKAELECKLLEAPEREAERAWGDKGEVVRPSDQKHAQLVSVHVPGQLGCRG